MRARTVSLALVLALAPGCTCQPTNGKQDCTPTVMAEAQTQVDSALSGNTSCTVDSDCVLVETPCKIASNTCGFTFSAVSVSGQAAVEHAFSVTAAEVCETCTPVPSGNNEVGPPSPDCSFGSPGASCSGNQCTVALVFPDGGSFESFCPQPRCPTLGQYCDVQLSPCARASISYFTLQISQGTCRSISGSLGGSCDVSERCGLGLNCVGADGGSGTGKCSGICPTQPEPTFCDGGCELTSDNHGCMVCYCPNGCPTFADGG